MTYTTEEIRSIKARFRPYEAWIRAEQIRAFYSLNLDSTYPSVANEFGVSDSYVYRIINNKACVEAPEFIPDGMKRCTKCTKILPLIAFRKYKRNSDGLTSWCYDCHNKGNTEWRENNPEYNKEYYEENPEKYLAARNRRRVRLAKCYESSATVDEMVNLKKFATECAMCNGEFDNERYKKSYEHIIQICLGGSNALSNLAITCWECNNSRPTRRLDWFAYQHMNKWECES